MDLTAKPVDDRSGLILRIAGSRREGDKTRYDLRYIGHEPGQHDLRDYLLLGGVSAAGVLPEIHVEIEGLLPHDHNGLLEMPGPGRLPRVGGYRFLIGLAVALWCVGPIVMVVRRGKQKIQREVLPDIMPEPSLADLLRPHACAAVDGKLDVEGKARLERLLLGHWREKLDLAGLDMYAALTQLALHPEGGRLLRNLADWLHRPPGSCAVHIESLLEPYRHVPAAACDGRKQN
jgi:hypothetical protein